MKVFWNLLMRPEIREAVAKILDVQQAWLRGELEAEEAVKQIVNIVMAVLMPGVQEPQVQIKIKTSDGS